MAAGPARFIEIDSKPSMAFNWHLLKAPTAVQTAVTAAKLSQRLRSVSFAEDYFDFADVSWCKAIRVQLWGVCAANDDPIVNLYGWHENGPGQHIGTITSTIGAITSQDLNNAGPGWHTDTNLHPAIRNAFDPATDYLTCDAYAVTADYEADFIVDTAATPINYQEHRALWVPASTAAGGTAPEADFPSFFVVDLTRSRYKYLCVACTNLDGGTSIGAIFKPAVLA